MQHFPPIAQPFNAIRVPFKGRFYTGDNFATYPTDQTPPFDLTNIQRGGFEPHSREDVAAMLQAWLFFGLLQEILQLDINQADFVENGSSEETPKSRFITTAKLRTYLHRWRADHEVARSDSVEFARRRNRVLAALRTSHAAFTDFDDFTAIVGPEVELSIQLLATALEHAVTCINAGANPLKHEAWVNAYETPWRNVPNAFIEERLKQTGWCPSVIRQMGRPCKLGLQTFLSLLRPSFEKIPGAHAQCEWGDVACRSSNIDEHTYMTKHVDDCECLNMQPESFLNVDAEQLREILREGGIPTVYLEDGERQSTPQLKLVSHRHEFHYTAISHVWADGLGNPRANALPLCQIKRLQHCLRKTNFTDVSKHSPVQYHDSVWGDDESGPSEPRLTAEEFHAAPLYFWMDTLCVPPGAEDRHLRKAAIQNMRAVYSRANRVIVLDSALLKTPGYRDDPDVPDSIGSEEIVARVDASSWVRRYWTLQEGLLAKNLYFQFKDTAFKIIDPPSQKENWYSHFFDDEVAYFADVQTDFRMRSRALNLRYFARVFSIWRELSARTASHKADEAICVATLLDMDLLPVLDAPPANRIAALWPMYEEFPVGVLCRPAAKGDDALRPWAFKHMTDCAQLVSPTSVPAIQREGVLFFTHHGLLITETLRENPSGVIAISIDEGTYFIRQNNKNGNKPWEGIDFTSPGTRMALLLGQDTPSPISGCLGALISLSASQVSHFEDTGVVKGEYLRAVSVMKQGSVFEERATPPWTADEEQEKSLIYPAVMLHSEQEWEIHGNAGDTAA